MRKTFVWSSGLAALAASACAVSTDEGSTLRSHESALSEDDCTQGYECASPTWTYDVTPQWPNDWGSADYCVGRKCKKGEGDCDSDSQCEAGLKCVERRGAFVGLQADWEICWPTDHVCKDLGPCVDGEGDCDSYPGRQGPRQCVEGTFCKEEGTVDRCRTRTPDDLNSFLGGFTVTAPGWSAAVFDDDGMIGIGVRGVKKSGESAVMQKADKIYLGSNSKAMTATLAAVLDSKDEIDWNDPDDKHTKLAVYNNNPRPLLDLLGQRGGFPHDANYVQGDDPVDQERHNYTKVAWKTQPAINPGNYFYSNTGFVVAADLMGHWADDTFEAMIEEHVWGPLGMNCGFGAAGISTWGHDRELVTLPGGALVPTWVPTKNDFDAILNSAARVVCSLEDYGKFLREHIRGATDRSALLPLSYYQTMHDGSEEGAYMAGWQIGSYGAHYSLNHNGSNSHHYVTTIVVPERNIAVVVYANSAFAGDFLSPSPVASQVAAVRDALLIKYRP